jgi:hypothetical protein
VNASRLARLGSVLLWMGCAGGAGGGGTDPSRLTSTELTAAASSAGETLYATLLRVRPQWLVAPSGRPGATVFIDQVETGPVSTLQVIPTDAVLSVQFLAPQAASSRFGRSLEGGAIDVRLSP